MDLVGAVGDHSVRAAARTARPAGSPGCTPPAPCSLDRPVDDPIDHARGVAILMAWISVCAPRLPTVSISQAVFSTSSRSCSIGDPGLRDPVPDHALLRPAACRSAVAGRARRHISSSARSAMPISRMQWWIRPGPSRACAIAKPPPSLADQVLGAAPRTSSNVTSAWPPCVAVGRSRTRCMPRSTVTPGVSRGTQDHALLVVRLAVRVGLAHHDEDPAVAGSSRPEMHHLRPLMTYSSPSRTMRGGDVGGVGGGHVGLGHRRTPTGSRRPAAAPATAAAAPASPNRASTSMFPVSGAAQFVAVGARCRAAAGDLGERGVLAGWSGRRRARRRAGTGSTGPRVRASALSSSTTTGRVAHGERPGRARAARGGRPARPVDVLVR